MSPLDLDGLQSVIDSASPAPWQVSLNASGAVIAPNRKHSMDADELRDYGGPVVGESIQGPDQVFIIVARGALPALLAELRAAREENETQGRTIQDLKVSESRAKALCVKQEIELRAARKVVEATRGHDCSTRWRQPCGHQFKALAIYDQVAGEAPR